MKELEQIPEECREGYARLVSEMVKFFSIAKRSGKAEVNFKEGVPMNIVPSPNVHLNK